MSDIIVKKNGEPYASEAVARQQMSAMYMAKTHKVVPYKGGYGLQIKGPEHPITLQPGDYVSTEGMDEATYHKVAEAFIAAGADSEGDHEWFRHCGAVRDGAETVLVWDCRDNEFWEAPSHTSHTSGATGRHLTIAQVLNATNAGSQQEQPMKTAKLEYDVSHSLIQTLKQRRQERDDAEAAYQDALAAVREQLGDGFTLVDNDSPAPTVRDLPPEEWREGDLVVRTDSSAPNVYTKDKIYEVKGVSDGLVEIYDNFGGGSSCRASYELTAMKFRFHSRPGA